jgi:predicted outer membrane protein
VTGGGLVTYGPAIPNNQFDLFQQVAISNNAVMFLTQLEILKGTNATLQQASASVLTDARNLDLLASNVADPLGVPLPEDLQGSTMTTVRQAALAANAGSFDQAYLTAMNTVGTTLVSQLQMLQGSGINSSLSTFATTALPIVQTDTAALKSIASGGSNTLTPVSSSPSSTTLSSTDLSTLESSYSTTNTERFLGQLTDLVSNTLQVQLYGDKLVNDHEQESDTLGRYAAATGTYLPAAIQGNDVTTATQVLGAIVTSGSTTSYDRSYLQAMVTSHMQDMSSNENTVNTTSNLVLKAFAVGDLPTDLMHLNGALYLLQHTGGASSTTRAAVRHADRAATHTIRMASR